MKNFNKKTLGLFLLLVIFVIFGFILYVKLSTINLSLSNPINLSLSNPIAKNVQYPSLLSDNKLRYYNGSSFIEYDLSNQKTKDLTPKFNLPNVYGAVWGDSSVAFVADNINPGNSLYQILMSLNLSTDGGYWWALDFKSNTLQVIGSDNAINSLIWQKGSNSWVATLNPQGDAATSSLSIGSFGLNPTIINVGGNGFFKSLWADKYSIIGSFSGDNTNNTVKVLIEKYDISQKKLDKLYDITNGTSFSFNNSGDSFLYIQLSKYITDGDLKGALIFNNASKVKTVNDAFTGPKTWSNYSNNWVALNNNNKGYSGSIYTDNQLKGFNIELPKKFDKQFNNVQSGSNFILLVDNELSAYVASTNKNFVKSFTTSVNDSQDETLLIRDALKPIVEDNYTINYYKDTQSYVIMVYGNPFSKYRDNALSLIRDKYGLDPNQLNISWDFGRGVDPSK